MTDALKLKVVVTKRGTFRVYAGDKPIAGVLDVEIGKPDAASMRTPTEVRIVLAATRVEIEQEK